ncbi:MAG: hypothetical protein NVS4B7_05660 [Ktedonobacteraceae bacterium]
MQKRSQTSDKRQRLFTASEVAEFEYCPLVWWHEQFEPLAQVDSEELFARLVELEQENDSEAPALPEYQMVEQLLLRKGAFEEGRQQHLEHAEEVEELQEERIPTVRTSGKARVLAWIAIAVLIIAVLFIVAALFIR